MSVGLAPALPLVRDYVDGYGLVKDFVALAAQNLKMVVLTAPGERIMNPFFGVGIRNFLFEPSISFTYGAIRAKIREQVQLFLPYIEISEIVINGSTADLTLQEQYVHVEIRYEILPLALNSVLELKVD